MIVVLRGLGWSLIGTGALIALYVFYLLFWTNRTTEAAQQELLEQWEVSFGELPVGDADPAAAPTADPEVAPPADAGDAYAAIWFERPGSDDPPMRDDVLFVVEGTGVEELKRGPGHYRDTAPPGGDGNFAISGHRTTYGAPFYHQDELRPGDLIHVVDRAGQRFTYAVRRSTIVRPTDVWVIGDDPLGTGNPTMTLTTCHPRFSAAQRLVTFAELVEA